MVASRGWNRRAGRTRQLVVVATAVAVVAALTPVLPAHATDGYDQAVAADSPLAYWRLDESSGSTAADQTGQRPGAISSGVTLGVPGVSPGEYAMRFDGAPCTGCQPSRNSLFAEFSHHVIP